MKQNLTDMYATYQDAEDLINIGAYPRGSSERIDRAIDRIDDINTFLRQGIDEETSPDEMLKLFEKTIGGLS
jgi:flagellum-specific ATP synthase